MKILVTGSTGFIGSAICRELVSRGEQVTAFHRSNSNTRPLDDLSIKHRIGDLNDPASLRAAVKGVDAVIHCAAQMGSTTDWKKFFGVTVLGTRTLLEEARHEKVRRFVHTSSVAALGVPEPGYRDHSTTLLSEMHTWNFSPQRWQYGYAKYLAELEVQRAVAEGLDAVIVNPSSVFGPGDVLRTQSSVIRMVTDHGLRLSAPGGMNVVHIRDVVLGHLAALDQGKCGERYILGGENLSHEQFFHHILDAAGLSSRIIVLSLPLVSMMRKLFFLTSRIFHLSINPGILNLAGYYFYYDLENSRINLGLPAPASASQAIKDAVYWFKEHPIS